MDALLAEIAKILKVPEEAIRNFNEETAIYNIQNNYEGVNTGTGSFGQYNNCTVNFADKVFELVKRKRINKN